MLRLYSIVLWLTGNATLLAAEPMWRVVETGSSVSLRGLAVAGQLSDAQSDAIWVTGAKGTVLITTDAGQTWRSCGPKNFPESDFRSIHAWNEQSSIIASAGMPAVVLKTDDGGASWREVYRDSTPAAFFDCLRFVDDKRGVLFGDPIDGYFTVLTTTDGGDQWQAVEAAQLLPVLPGEAAFAASNSAMLLAPPATIWIGTGGTESTTSRVHFSDDFGRSWKISQAPIASGPASGIFSLAYDATSNVLAAVGGDYRPEGKSTSTAAISRDRGRSFETARARPTAYRSSVVHTPGVAWLSAGFYSVGPTGTDFSADGQTWTKLTDVGFHALATQTNGSLVAVGSDGRVGWSSPNSPPPSK